MNLTLNYKESNLLVPKHFADRRMFAYSIFTFLIIQVVNILIKQLYS